jgi:hypothetical protein
MEPHPLFKAFIGASYEHRKRRLAGERMEERQEEPQFSRVD